MRTIKACALENLTDYHGKDKVRIFELLSEYLQKFVNKPITQILPNSINIRRLNKYFNNVFYSVLYDNLYIGEREIKSGRRYNFIFHIMLYNNISTNTDVYVVFIDNIIQSYVSFC